MSIQESKTYICDFCGDSVAGPKKLNQDNIPKGHDFLVARLVFKVRNKKGRYKPDICNKCRKDLADTISASFPSLNMEVNPI